MQEVLKESKRIREALEKAEREREGEKKKRDNWWNEDCEKKKRWVRRALREWRKKRGEITNYKREKKEYKELCGVKRREENERWEEEAGETKTEGQVWRIVN